MDTKSKKFSYLTLAKVLCFIISGVLLFLSAAGAASLAVNINNDDSPYIDAVRGNNDENIIMTYSFAQLCENQLYEIMLRALYFKDDSKETFVKTAKVLIDAQYKKTLDYCMSYDVDDLKDRDYVKLTYICDGYFDGYSDEYGDSSYAHSYKKNADNSYVEVPEGADRIYFSDGKIYAVKFDKKLMYEKATNDVYLTFSYFADLNRKALNDTKNLKYVVINKTDKTFYTNVSSLSKSSKTEEIKKYFSSFDWNLYDSSSTNTIFSDYIVKNIKPDYYSAYAPLSQNEITSEIEGAVANFTSLHFEATDNSEDEFEIYVAFDEKLSSDDDYSKFAQNISDASKEIITKGILIIVGAISVLFSLIYLIITAGRKEKGGQVKLVFVDKVFTILHFGVCMILLFICMLIAKELASEMMEIGDTDMFDNFLPWLFGLTAVAAYAAFTEWLMSFSRNVKNKTFFKHTLVGYLFFGVKNGESKKSARRRSLLLVILIVYAVIMTILTFCAADESVIAAIALIFMIIVGSLVVIFTAYYISTLIDKLDMCEGNYGKVSIDPRTYPEWLRPLVKHISKMQKNTNEAIESAIKDEKMKTELITNVSHDLKTPLTAVINYSDLLSQCEIDNEQAKEYIRIISEKSQRLKKLIEDLTDAAKASSGNIKTNFVSLNLNEAARQIAGEAEDQLNERNLELILSLPENPVTVTADSELTHRVLENLIGNVEKYAMPCSRVYIKVETDKSICVSNISEKILNITPEELKARFVRGDESRTTEGSGLGLAIAADLCKIQGGLLDISIDGDLFKATVRFETENQ